MQKAFSSPIRLSPKLGVMSLSENKSIRLFFDVGKQKTAGNLPSREYTFEGNVRAYEVMPDLLQNNNEDSYWLVVIFELSEPTYYLWFYRISPSKSSLEEINKVELGSDVVCHLAFRNKHLCIVYESHISVVLFTQGFGSLLSKSLSWEGQKNPKSLFDVIETPTGCCVVLPDKDALQVVNVDKSGNFERVLSWTVDPTHVQAVKLSLKGDLLAYAMEDVSLV